MKDQNTVTIQLTAKNLKAHKVVSGTMILIGLIIVVASSGEAPNSSGLVWGCLMSLFGFGYLAVTRIRIWWNHK